MRSPEQNEDGAWVPLALVTEAVHLQFSAFGFAVSSVLVQAAWEAATAARKSSRSFDMMEDWVAVEICGGFIVFVIRWVFLKAHELDSCR